MLLDRAEDTVNMVLAIFFLFSGLRVVSFARYSSPFRPHRPQNGIIFSLSFYFCFSFPPHLFFCIRSFSLLLRSAPAYPCIIIIIIVVIFYFFSFSLVCIEFSTSRYGVETSERDEQRKYTLKGYARKH